MNSLLGFLRWLNPDYLAGPIKARLLGKLRRLGCHVIEEIRRRTDRLPTCGRLLPRPHLPQTLGPTPNYRSSRSRSSSTFSKRILQDLKKPTPAQSHSTNERGPSSFCGEIIMQKSCHEKRNNEKIEKRKKGSGWSRWVLSRPRRRTGCQASL